MTIITQKQLIESLKDLKEIKPSRDWAVLLKSQILAVKQADVKVAKNPVRFVGFMDALKFVFLEKKLAYSLAVFLFLVVGIFGFAGYTVPGDLLFPVKKIAEQSQATLTGQPGLVATFNTRINDLAEVAKAGRTDNIPSAIDEIRVNASALAKNLKNNTASAQTIKDIVASYKTLADVPGTDLSAAPEMESLNNALAPYAENEIKDLQKTTLTDNQKITLAEIEDLYSQGKYAEALERILLINK